MWFSNFNLTQIYSFGICTICLCFQLHNTRLRALCKAYSLLIDSHRNARPLSWLSLTFGKARTRSRIDFLNMNVANRVEGPWLWPNKSAISHIASTWHVIHIHVACYFWKLFMNKNFFAKSLLLFSINCLSRPSVEQIKWGRKEGLCASTCDVHLPNVAFILTLNVFIRMHFMAILYLQNANICSANIIMF